MFEQILYFMQQIWYYIIKIKIVFSLEYFTYVIVFLVLSIIIFYSFIKIKYGFWIIQPVFHIYDLGYMFNPPGIIKHDLPIQNKYTNFKNIQTSNKLNEHQIQRFLTLIRFHYLRNKDNVFIPHIENILPYFNNHNHPSFFTLYHEPTSIIEQKTNNVIKDTKVIGAITSRPVFIQINNDFTTDKNNSGFYANYVDYLCVDKKYRKQGIAPQLIQTHNYNQQHLNKNISVSLFKREEELTGIVPLCVYSTYGFSVNKWTKPAELSAEYKLLEINPQNYRFLIDFMKLNSTKFDIIINADVANIIELIKTKNIFIYTIVSDDDIICAYFFRKTCIEIEKGMEVLTCFASINNTNNDLFIQGFKISFWKIAAENFFGFCAIESVSHNHILIDNIIQRTPPLIISPTAYFFYNFAYPTFQSKKVFVLC